MREVGCDVSCSLSTSASWLPQILVNEVLAYGPCVYAAFRAVDVQVNALFLTLTTFDTHMELTSTTTRQLIRNEPRKLTVGAASKNSSPRRGHTHNHTETRRRRDRPQQPALCTSLCTLLSLTHLTALSHACEHGSRFRHGHHNGLWLPLSPRS